MAIKKSFHSKLLNRYTNVRQGFIGKDKRGWWFTGAQLDFNKLSLASIRRSLNLKKWEKVVIGDQQHTNKVAVLKTLKKQAAKVVTVPRCDGLVTGESGVILLVYSADCLPVMFYDKKKKVIGLCHAGRQGVYKEIITQVLKIMTVNFGSQMSDIFVCIGPSIGPCHYQVGSEIAARFIRKFGEIGVLLKSRRYYLDLWRLAQRQLIGNKVKKSQIEVTRLCTVCHNEKFYSRRAEGDFKQRQGTNWAFIGLKEPITNANKIRL